MILHEHKCIFIHIPKCAGTSIELALGHLNDPEERGAQDHRSIRMIEMPAITLGTFSSKENILEIARRVRHQYVGKDTNPRNKFTVTKEQYDSYFKFTFIRNPWSRAFSVYVNVMRDKFHQKEYGITNQISLNAFLKLAVGKGFLRPQLYWMRDFNGCIPFDYIGRFENLAEDFRQICMRLGMAGLALPHENKGMSQDYRDYYDGASKDMILRAYKEEIDRFDYSFEM
jgi:hypothetical protein